MKVVYSYDKNAPRMRKGKFSTRVITKDLWKKFKKEFPDYENLSWNEFYQIWQEIAERVRYYSIYNPLGVKLGSYLGELKFQYLPHKFKAKDYNTSLNEGVEIIHTNITEKGKVPTIKWERRWAVGFNKILQFYSFSETREMNNLAKERIKQNSDDIRISRNTLGGHSVWRQKINK